MFVAHSFPPLMSESVLLFRNSMDSIPADMVQKRTQLDLQKRFPSWHVCPKCLAALLCGSAFLLNGLAFLQELDEVGKRLVDRQRGMGISTANRFSILKILGIVHTIYFICNSCTRPESSRIVSRSSTNFLLEIVSNVEP